MSNESINKTTGKKRTAGRNASPQSARAPSKPDVAALSSRRWTFLTNHAHVLGILHSDPDLVLREVAARVGITERAVQRIIHDLEDEGFIRREKVGRQNRYQVNTNKSLRHPIEAHCKIGDLLSLVSERTPGR